MTIRIKAAQAAIALSSIAALASPLAAQGVAELEFGERSRGGVELAPYLQCVPYARQVSGIALYGDAYTWWDQAEGRYARGNEPRVGAVMAFASHRNMELGHVATVARVIDRRTVLLDHANWSPINGRRGQVESGVRAIDVSPDNDWSAVRVWYDPLQAVGNTAWPVHGFIYSDRPHRAKMRIAAAPARKETSRRFLNAFAGLAD